MSHILIMNDHVAPFYGGVERISCVIAKIFKEKGNRVFFASRYLDSYTEKLPYDKVLSGFDNIISFMEENKITTVINQVGHDPYYINILNYIRKKKKDINILTCLHTDPLFFLKTIRESLSFKYRPTFLLKLKVFFIYLLFPFYFLYKNLYVGITYCRLYSKSDYFILLSPKLIPSFRRITLFKEYGKLVAIPNPCYKMNSYGFCEKEKVVLIVSRLSQYKRIDIIIQIWASIMKQHPQLKEWKLKILGEGEEKERLEILINMNNLLNVQLEGYVENPEDEYKKASLFVMASLYEGFPVTLLEAQINGVIPIVFDSFLSVSDLVNNNISGHIVENKNIKEFECKLRDLMLNGEKRKSMAANTVKNMDKFLPENIYLKWKKVIR